MDNIFHIKTDTDLTLFIEGEISVFAKDSRYYSTALEAIENKDRQALSVAVNLQKHIKEYSEGSFTVDGGTIFVDEEPIDSLIADYVAKFYHAGKEYMPLLNFIRRLRKNPSSSSVKDLYRCLAVNKHPILADGRFLAYKTVNQDWTDWKTGSISNKPGKKPKMKRNEVDDDSNVTCSRGLHVASFDYASRFMREGRLIICAVDPADVVAVPNDYNQQKMRTCKYEVIEEVDRKEIEDLTYDWGVDFCSDCRNLTDFCVCDDLLQEEVDGEEDQGIGVCGSCSGVGGEDFSTYECKACLAEACQLCADSNSFTTCDDCDEWICGYHQFLEGVDYIKCEDCFHSSYCSGCGEWTDEEFLNPCCKTTSPRVTECSKLLCSDCGPKCTACAKKDCCDQCGNVIGSENHWHNESRDSLICVDCMNDIDQKKGDSNCTKE